MRSVLLVMQKYLLLNKDFFFPWCHKVFFKFYFRIAFQQFLLYTTKEQHMPSLTGITMLKVHHLSSISTCCLCSAAKSCPTLRDPPMDCSTPDFPVHHQLLELAQTHVHGVGDAIQPSHPLSPSSPPAFSLSQHQGLFQWVGCSHQVTKLLELQLQSFQWVFWVDFP